MRKLCCRRPSLQWKCYKILGYSCMRNMWCCCNSQGLTVLIWFTLTGRTSAGRSKLLVSDWSEEDVSAWLVEEGLERLVDKFTANNIDGTELLGLTKETLASELHIGEEHTRTHTRCLASAMPICQSTILPQITIIQSLRIWARSLGLLITHLPSCEKEPGRCVCGLSFLCLVARIKSYILNQMKEFIHEIWRGFYWQDHIILGCTAKEVSCWASTVLNLISISCITRSLKRRFPSGGFPPRVVGLSWLFQSLSEMF